MTAGGFGPVVITQADARQLPLPDESVDLIITSPPFLNLRSYQDGGAHMEHQIGAGTREEYLAQLWQATAEMRRVLKPAGSLFVELGDSYTDKCLNMTPHRYAIGCVDRLGLILRAEVVWSRPWITSRRWRRRWRVGSCWAGPRAAFVRTAGFY
jgi:DNA modification methylase